MSPLYQINRMKWNSQSGHVTYFCIFGDSGFLISVAIKGLLYFWIYYNLQVLSIRENPYQALCIFLYYGSPSPYYYCISFTFASFCISDAPTLLQQSGHVNSWPGRRQFGIDQESPASFILVTCVLLVTCVFHILKYFILPIHGSFKLSHCKQDEGLDAQNAESPHLLVLFSVPITFWNNPNLSDLGPLFQIQISFLDL